MKECHQISGTPFTETSLTSLEMNSINREAGARRREYTVLWGPAILVPGAGDQARDQARDQRAVMK